MQLATCVYLEDSWTWVQGSKEANAEGAYDTSLGLSGGTLPGSNAAVAYCYDTSERSLFLFGGTIGRTEGGSSVGDDLWYHDLSTGKWTFLGNNTSKLITDGSLDNASLVNMWPPMRNNALLLCDLQNDRLILHGGHFSNVSSVNGKLNNIL